MCGSSVLSASRSLSWSPKVVGDGGIVEDDDAERTPGSRSSTHPRKRLALALLDVQNFGPLRELVVQQELPSQFNGVLRVLRTSMMTSSGSCVPMLSSVSMHYSV